MFLANVHGHQWMSERWDTGKQSLELQDQSAHLTILRRGLLTFENVLNISMDAESKAMRVYLKMEPLEKSATNAQKPKLSPITMGKITAYLCSLKLLDLWSAFEHGFTPNPMERVPSTSNLAKHSDRVVKRLADWVNVVNKAAQSMTLASHAGNLDAGEAGGSEESIPKVERLTVKSMLAHIGHVVSRAKTTAAAFEIIQSLGLAAMHLGVLLQHDFSKDGSVPDWSEELMESCLTPEFIQDRGRKTQWSDLRKALWTAAMISPIFLLCDLSPSRWRWENKDILQYSSDLGNSKPEIIRDIEQTIWRFLYRVAHLEIDLEAGARQLLRDTQAKLAATPILYNHWFKISDPPAPSAPIPIPSNPTQQASPPITPQLPQSSSHGAHDPENPSTISPSATVPQPPINSSHTPESIGQNNSQQRMFRVIRQSNKRNENSNPASFGVINNEKQAPSPKNAGEGNGNNSTGQPPESSSPTIEGFKVGALWVELYDLMRSPLSIHVIHTRLRNKAIEHGVNYAEERWSKVMDQLLPDADSAFEDEVFDKILQAHLQCTLTDLLRDKGRGDMGLAENKKRSHSSESGKNSLKAKNQENQRESDGSGKDEAKNPITKDGKQTRGPTLKKTNGSESKSVPNDGSQTINSNGKRTSGSSSKDDEGSKNKKQKTQRNSAQTGVPRLFGLSHRQVGPSYTTFSGMGTAFSQQTQLIRLEHGYGQPKVRHSLSNAETSVVTIEPYSLTNARGDQVYYEIPSHFDEDEETIRKWVEAIEAQYCDDGLPLHISRPSESMFTVMTWDDFQDAGLVQPTLDKHHIIVTDMPHGKLDLKFTEETLSRVGDLFAPIPIHDFSLNETNPNARIKFGTLNDVIDASNSDTGKILNAISLPLTSIEDPQPSFSADLAAWNATRSSAISSPEESVPAPHIRWGLVSLAGAYTGVHMETDGWATFVDPLAGAKLWIVCSPRDEDGMQTTGYLEDGLDQYEPPPKESWRIEAVILEPGIGLAMRPNTLHMVITLEDAVFKGGHFYSAFNLRDTAMGLAHCLASNFITNSPFTSSSRTMLQRLILFFHKHFVKGEVTESKMAYIPDLGTSTGISSFLSAAMLGVCMVIFDPLAYQALPSSNTSPQGGRDQLVKTLCCALTTEERDRYTFMRGVSIELVEWLVANYEVTGDETTELLRKPRKAVSSQSDSMTSERIFYAMGIWVLKVKNYAERMKDTEATFHPDIPVLDAWVNSIFFGALENARTAYNSRHAKDQKLMKVLAPFLEGWNAVERSMPLDFQPKNDVALFESAYSKAEESWEQLSFGRKKVAKELNMSNLSQPKKRKGKKKSSTTRG